VNSVCVGAISAGVALTAPGTELRSAEQCRETIARFERAWRPQKGYMRPLDDEGWRVRMTALVELMRHENDAGLELSRVLSGGEPETRIFAAQALAYLADPRTRPALEAALQDDVAAVRLYAVDALGRLGRLPNTQRLLEMRQRDPNRDVQAVVGFGLERDDEPNPSALKRALRGIDPLQLGAAKLGRRAPDFSLDDPRGRRFRLSQYRGKNPVVLVFIYGDT
jgi:hypothetical protein